MIEQVWICTICDRIDPPQGACKLIVTGTEDDLSQNKPGKCPYWTTSEWEMVSKEEPKP